MRAAGFENLRLVLQQWTPNVRPSQATIDGAPPEVLLISSMQIHSAAAYALISDAWTMGDRRPLILVGGAKAIYEPWDFFGLSADRRVGADVVVTGEEFVSLELFDRLLAHKGRGESMRQAFQRVRREGHLEDIAGLVYRLDEDNGPNDVLVNTGIQRLVQLPLAHGRAGLLRTETPSANAVAAPPGRRPPASLREGCRRGHHAWLQVSLFLLSHSRL